MLPSGSSGASVSEHGMNEATWLRVKLAFALGRELKHKHAADDALWLKDRAERIAGKLRGQLTRAYTRRFASRLRTR